MAEKDSLLQIRESIKNRYEESKRVLSFDEYLQHVDRDAYPALRSSSHYVLDGIEHFGTQDISVRGHVEKRYKIFDQAFLENPQPIVGHESVQKALHQVLTGFVRVGRASKLVLLHGPNGSAKSSLVRTLAQGLEAYSKTNEGQIFSFSWIFPHENYAKSGLGIGGPRDTSSTHSGADSYAKLDQEKIGAIVRSELHDNPLYLIPREERRSLFEAWLKTEKDPEKKERLENLRDRFLKSELSHKSALIFDALLDDYRGDYLKVLRHVRVERLFFSRPFRKGLVSIGPQFGVDAHIRQVTLDRTIANLPPALQSLNLFQLEGDLIDANRGLVEYDDLLKRPVEHFKYLLNTCETGTVNLAHVVAFLDCVLLATTNDRQLEAFREHPEFNSFKARMEFVRVPYLLRYTEEEKIYRETAIRSAGQKELVPHTTRVLAMWAVLTRLKPPMTKNKNPLLSRLLENLSPLQKAKIYDGGELPERLNDEERRELRHHVEDLVAEHQTQPYYEGMFGASARELKSILQMAAQNDNFANLSPNAVFYELGQMVKHNRDYEYLRQEPVQGYFAFEDFINVVRNEWLNWVDREVRNSVGLQDDAQLKEHLQKYVGQVTAHVRAERIKNRITGDFELPDQALMRDFEEMVDMQGDADEFRKNFITRLGAWSLEHPGRDMAKGLPFMEIFPEFVDKIQQKTFEQQSAKMRAMGAFVLDIQSFDTATDSLDNQKLSEHAAMAVKAYQELQKRYGYGPAGAREVLRELVRARYVA